MVAASSQNDLNGLIAALARPRSERPSEDSDRREFDDLRHTLRQLIGGISDEKQFDQNRKLLRNLILECSPRAAVLHDVMIHLGEAERCLENRRVDLAIPKLEDIRNQLGALEDAPRHFVYQLCNDHRGPLENPMFAISPWAEIIDSKTPHSPALPFDLGELRMAVAALRANAERNRGNRDVLEYFLAYREWEQISEIMWLEHSSWDAYISATDFKTAADVLLCAAQKSLKSKVLYRGLSQVILFAIENRAIRVELLHGSKWHLLWETGETKTNIGDDNCYSWITQSTKRSLDVNDLNYGWRFIFARGEKAGKKQRPKVGWHGGSPSNQNEERTLSVRPVFLCDDDENADWPDLVKKHLTDSGYAPEMITIIKGVGEAATPSALIESWMVEMKTLSNQHQSADFDVVTDSQFMNLDTGGQDLLNQLCNSQPAMLHRGIVYSVSPHLDENHLPACEKLRKNEHDMSDDARRIECFLRTGAFPSLDSVIAMIERLSETLGPLLAVVTEAPWILRSNGHDPSEAWRADLDPWNALRQSYGDQVPTPYASASWEYFTDSDGLEAGYLDEMIRRFGEANGPSMADLIRGCLCPVQSVVDIVEAPEFPHPWKGNEAVGGIRVLIDLCSNPAGFGSLDGSLQERAKAIDWVDKRAKPIRHRDVALKYCHYLERYRNECLSRVNASDFNDIKAAADKQIAKLTRFLAQWKHYEI